MEPLDALKALMAEELFPFSVPDLRAPWDTNHGWWIYCPHVASLERRLADARAAIAQAEEKKMAEHVTPLPVGRVETLRMRNNHDALLAALKEMRDFAAACCRVIANADDTVVLEAELHEAGIHPGVGVRAQSAIEKAEATR